VHGGTTTTNDTHTPRQDNVVREMPVQSVVSYPPQNATVALGMCVHVPMCVCVCVYVYVNVNVYWCVCVCISVVNVHTLTRILTRSLSLICMHSRTLPHTRTLTHTHTLTHVSHTHTYTYT
jgi:hypothetical protein